MFRTGLNRIINSEASCLAANRNIIHGSLDIFPLFGAAVSARQLSSAGTSRKSNSDSELAKKIVKRNTSQTPAAPKTSLRRAAVESERSRAGIKVFKADRDADAKVVTAYCAAEQYAIASVAKILRNAGYALDPCRTGLFPHVVHFQVGGEDARDSIHNPRDIFVFPSGAVVTWDVDEDFVRKLISKTLLPSAESSNVDVMETEDLEYIEDPTTSASSIVGDKIHLGTRRDSEEADTNHQHAADLILVKTAFSSGLARSVKLAVLENSLDSYFRSTRTIPTLLSRGSRLPFTRSFILRKTGELLTARAQLNLNSELTDSLPDMFWDSRHELGLEGYFDRVGRALDVGVRSRVLNQKMDYAQEIVSVLREQLSERHGLMLEWLIIILISFEVGFEILRLWKERSEREDPESTEALVRRFLEKELRD